MVASPLNSQEPSSDAPQRIFIGVPIPEDFRRRLQTTLAEVPIPGRPVPARNWHITLRFIGATPESTVRGLTENLRKACFGDAFDLTFGKLGAFPRPARAAVLWLGIEQGCDALASMAANVEQAVQQIGLPPADRTFRAHLTLSRLSPPADVRSALDRDLGLEEPMSVGEVVLFRSLPGRGPAVYETVERFPLRDPSPTT